MAYDTTILNGDVGVWWLPNNRTKMLDWVGGTNEDYTMNELYSAMANLQDEPTTVDDGTAFFADTPVEYTIGKIDAGDNDPFYITFALMQRIKGGSLRTTGWTRVQDSNIGIVIVPVSSNTFVSGDIGALIEHAGDGDDGTLLEIIDDGTDVYLVIRPDTDAITDSWDSASGSIQVEGGGGNSATQDAAGTTGEMIWANLYSIGTIDPQVHLYVYQGARLEVDASDRVYDVNDATKDYWANGHFDICVPIKEYVSTTWAVVDGGYMRVFARKGGDLFSSFEVSTSIVSGGRNPIPLQSSLDLDAGYSSEAGRGHGTKKISTGAWSGTFTNGEIITQATSLARGIIDLTNSTDGSEIVYWPICEDAVGGELTLMADTFLITGVDSGETATASSVSTDDGPAIASWFTSTVMPTIVFANNQVDIDNDGNDENWGVTVDCNANPLTEVYQWLKFICQFGRGTGDVIETAETGVQGEEYEGGTAYFGYSVINGTNDEGDSVTQDNTLATGVILSHDAATNDIVLLRSTRGIFNGSDIIRNDDTPGANNFTPDEEGNFAFTAAAPLGTFAGGTFFGARGVVLTDYLAADENSFILTDIEGNSRQRPTSITIEVTNLSGNAVTETDADLVTIYYLTGVGGDIEKTTMTADGGETVGTGTLDVDDIPTWVPAAGRLILVDVDDDNQEYVIGYASWNGTTDQFTLDSLTPANLTAGTDPTTLVSTTDELDGLKRGDLVVNDTQGLVSYVTDVQAGSDTVNIYPAITGQTSGDTIYINTTPDITVDAADQVFVAIMHRYALSATEDVAIIYPGSTVYFRTKVRNTRETDLVNGPIKPYSSDGSTSGTDQSIPVVRTIDTIIS